NESQREQWVGGKPTVKEMRWCHRQKARGYQTKAFALEERPADEIHQDDIDQSDQRRRKTDHRFRQREDSYEERLRVDMDRLRPVDRTGGPRGTVPIQDVEVQGEDIPVQIAAGCGERPSMDAEKYFIVTEIDWR